MAWSLLQNYKAKIVVLFMAILLWFYVALEKQYEYTIEIPIQPMNLEKDKAIENEIPRTAAVRFRGEGWPLLSLLLTREARVSLDLNGVAGQRLFRLGPRDVSVPRRGTELEVLEVVEPDTVRVILSRLVERQVPVYPEVSITPLDGYTMVGDILVLPQSATIEGPDRFVSTVDTIFTEKRLFKGVARPLRERLNLVPPSAPKVSVDIKQVEIYADIQKIGEKTISEIPVAVHNPPKSARLTVIPSTLTLTVEGGVEVLAPLTKKDIRAYIDYQRPLSPEENEFAAFIELPKGVTYTAVKPRTFKVVLQPIKEEPRAAGNNPTAAALKEKGKE